MAPQFHSLRISKIESLTQDSIALSFAVPPELKAAYQFTQGQFITLKAKVQGQELRRSYSICQSVAHYAAHSELRVGIKAVGVFSNFAQAEFKVGQSLDVMTPDGRFFTPLQAENKKHYLAFAGGSGITPVLSIIATTLATEPQSRFTLIYGNRSVAAMMFLEELAALKNLYLARFDWHNVVSDEPQEIALHYGVLNGEKCSEFLRAVVHVETLDAAFICGPAPMMDAAEAALHKAGVAASKIHVERFGTPLPTASENALKHTARGKNGTSAKNVEEKTAKVTFYLDGSTRVIKLPYEGEALLDAALKTGANLPYACKAGVCCTCRAKVLQGKMRMAKNYTLQADEIAQGFVLTCQAHPMSDEVVVSYDER